MRRPDRSRKRSRPAAAAGELVDGILKKYGAMQGVREHRLVTAWVEIVGDRVAARAWPDGLRDGVLSVRVANSAWMHELSFLREAVTRRANELVGPPRLVREVRFHLGANRRTEADADDVVAALARRKAQRRPPPRRRPPPPTAETLARIDAETAQVADPELRDTLRALRRRLGL